MRSISAYLLMYIQYAHRYCTFTWFPYAYNDIEFPQEGAGGILEKKCVAPVYVSCRDIIVDDPQINLLT